jgi:hypothetical protein
LPCAYSLLLRKRLAVGYTSSRTGGHILVLRLGRSTQSRRKELWQATWHAHTTNYAESQTHSFLTFRGRSYRLLSPQRISSSMMKRKKTMVMKCVAPLTLYSSNGQVNPERERKMRGQLLWCLRIGLRIAESPYKQLRNFACGTV